MANIDIVLAVVVLLVCYTLDQALCLEVLLNRTGNPFLNMVIDSRNGDVLVSSMDRFHKVENAGRISEFAVIGSNSDALLLMHGNSGMVIHCSSSLFYTCYKFFMNDIDSQDKMSSTYTIHMHHNSVAMAYFGDMGKEYPAIYMAGRFRYGTFPGFGYNPSITVWSVHETGFNIEIQITFGHIDSNFILSFQLQDYAYFVTNQESTIRGGTEVIPSGSRIFQIPTYLYSNPVSYVDIPLECKSVGDSSTYRWIQLSVVIKDTDNFSKNDDVLLAAFTSVNDGDKHSPSYAICKFSMKELREQMEHIRTLCYSLMGKVKLYRGSSSSALQYPDRRHTLCKILPVEATYLISIQEGNAITSLNADIIGTTMTLYVGLANGVVKKVKFNGDDVKEGIIAVDKGHAITNMLHGPNREDLYVLTPDKLVLIHNTDETTIKISTITLIIVVLATLMMACCIFTCIRRKCCKQRKGAVNSEDESVCQSESELEVFNKSTTSSCDGAEDTLLATRSQCRLPADANKIKDIADLMTSQNKLQIHHLIEEGDVADPDTSAMLMLKYLQMKGDG